MKHAWRACGFGILMILGSGCATVPVDEQTMRIGDRSVIVEVASTPAQQERGLSGRDALRPARGMLFIFPQKGTYPFWMKEMRFPIDLIWIADQKIVKIEHHLPAPSPSKPFPVTVYPPEPIDRVLEVTAGQADALGLKEGMTL